MTDTPIPAELETYWTVGQIAAAFQVTGETVRTWIADGQLPAVKLGNEWRIKNVDLVAFTQERYSKK